MYVSTFCYASFSFTNMNGIQIFGVTDDALPLSINILVSFIVKVDKRLDKFWDHQLISSETSLSKGSLLTYL